LSKPFNPGPGPSEADRQWWSDRLDRATDAEKRMVLILDEFMMVDGQLRVILEQSKRLELFASIKDEPGVALLATTLPFARELVAVAKRALKSIDELYRQKERR